MPQNAAQIGEYLLGKLKSVLDKKRIVGEVRGKGLIIGIELVKDKKTKEPLHKDTVQELGLDASSRGLLLYFSGNVLGLVPPLIIDQAIADEIIKILDKVLDIGPGANIKRKARLAKELAITKLKS